MNNQPKMKMPKDAAQIVLWFDGLPQPTAFLTTRVEADVVLADFREDKPYISFFSYPDGHGVQSESVFSLYDLRGVTIEYETIQFAERV